MASPYAPVVDANGISAPDFATILAQLTSDYQAIFGADVYLGNDSKDGQFLAIIAQAITDLCAAAVAVYNSFSPSTAQGNGLRSVIKINGLKVNIASASTVTVTIAGQANTQITNGLASDTNGNTWALPGLVTIPSTGSINVTATCTQLGATLAAPGTINKIKTPVSGWQSVTNAASANPGSAAETDAHIRQRQAQSTSLPSVLVFDGIVASLLAVPGVTRVAAYENNTASVNILGIAANTLAFIVEGGANADIFNAIALKAPPGIPTAGAQTQTVTSQSGSTRVINFDRPTNATITTNLTIKALAGWSVGTEAVITAAINDYLNNLAGGQVVGFLDIAPLARLIDTPYAATFRITAITLAKNGGTAAAADITLNYNEMAVAGPVNFTVT